MSTVERADQVAEDALLDRAALLRIQPHDLRQLAREHVVRALLDDHPMPPRQRYLTSSHSSMPYLDPSRPMPDSFTPPNGATSVEMTPVLMPTIPYSSASATRHTRADVAAVEVAREAVRRVVGLADRVRLGREPADARDGAERLLAAHRASRP